MVNRIQLRGGTAAQWTAANPVLAAKEPGVESDTGKIKVGNGTTAWNSLPYSGASVTYGTADGTAAAGNDARIVGAAQRTGGNTFTGAQDFTGATVTGVTATVSDATASVNGAVRLAGDLAGTATAPTVPGLALKADAVADVYRFTETYLPKTAQAFAKVRANAGDAKILMVGDSTFNGGSTIGQFASPPSQLATQLDKYLIPAANGLGIPPSNLTTVLDTRWTTGTGWSKGNVAGVWGFGGKASYEAVFSVGTTGNLVYADSRVLADTFDVYFMKTPTTGRGSALVTATGGTGVDTGSSTGTAGFYKVTVSAAAAATTNTVTIAPSANGGFTVIGVEPYLSTTSKVRIGNAGVNSSTTGNWVAPGTSGNAISALDAIRAYAPDCTFIQLGTNDGATNVTDTTFSSNLDSIITASAASGDVILMSAVPVSPSGMITLETAYTVVRKGKNKPLIDIFGRSGAAGGYTAWNAKGYMFDDRHPSALGAAVEAQIIAAAFRRLIS